MFLKRGPEGNPQVGWVGNQGEWSGWHGRWAYNIQMKQLAVSFNCRGGDSPERSTIGWLQNLEDLNFQGVDYRQRAISMKFLNRLHLLVGGNWQRSTRVRDLRIFFGDDSLNPRLI